MSSLSVFLLALGLFGVAYLVYGRVLKRLYQVDETRPTPALKKNDGVDFVPAKNWMVLFGHHFCSICGLGPIVGPAIAVAYWGWAPSVLWVLVGSVFAGAVADFSSLMLSVRYEGLSISTIARNEISERTRLFFSWFILVTLVLLIAVFTVLAAETLVAQPETVVPSFGLILIAVLAGQLIYRLKMGMLPVTLLCLGLMALSLYLGLRLPVLLPGDLSPHVIWIVILLFYCFIASILPVNALLQPRDYLASYLLIFTVVAGAVGIFVSNPAMDDTAFRAFNPSGLWPESGPLVPMLFITIACGAISGFHSLVASGTTCKQIATEKHAYSTGYGSMLLEGLVAVMVIVCIAGSLNYETTVELVREEGPIAAFAAGYASMTGPFLGQFGAVFVMLAINTFILTTLDTGTRIASYMAQELLGIKSRVLTTFMVIFTASVIAFSEGWQAIWPAFGTANQLIAGVALLVASCYLLKRKRNSLPALVPGVLMMLITIWALLYQILESIAASQTVMTVINALLLIIAFTMGYESFKQVRIHLGNLHTRS